MPNISCLVSDDTRLELIVTAPKNKDPICIELVDSESWDIALRIDINFRQSRLTLSSRVEKKWEKKPELELKFEKYNDISIRFARNTIYLEIQGNAFEYSLIKSVIDREIRIRTNFDYVSIGSGKNSEQHFAMRWPFLLRHESRPWLTSRLSLMADAIAHKVGVSAIVAYDGNETALADLISALHEEIDEIIVGIHDPSSVNIGFFSKLQSTYFNVIYHITPYMRNDNIGDADRAYFLNGLLERCSYRNVMLVDLYDDASKIRSVIQKNRLRIRRDHFAVVGFEGDARSPAMLALSLRKSTYVFESGSGLTLPDDDVVSRNIDFVGDVAMPGSLNWSVNICDKISDDGTFIKTPLISLRGYLKSYAPRLRPRVVVMIISCKGNRHKQNAIRETWVKDLNVANIEYVFVEGNPAIEKAIQIDDRIFVKSQDTYEYLSHKVHKSIKAIKEAYNPDYILKIDDDCACNVQKLLEIDLQGFEYLGTNFISGKNSTYDWHKKALSNEQLIGVLFKANKDISWFDGGGGYFLGRKAINVIAEMDLIKFSHMFEDYAVGRALCGKIKIPEMTCCQFTSIREGHIRSDEDYRNTLVIDVHSFERMQDIYQTFERENNRALGMRDGIDVVVS